MLNARDSLLIPIQSHAARCVQIGFSMNSAHSPFVWLDANHTHISNAISQIDFYNCTYAHLFILITPLRSFLSFFLDAGLFAFFLSFVFLFGGSWCLTISVFMLSIAIEANQTRLPIVEQEEKSLRSLATSQTTGDGRRRRRRQRKIIICDLLSINLQSTFHE